MNNFLFCGGFRRTWLQTDYILSVNLLTFGKLIRWPEFRFSVQCSWEWNAYLWKLSQRLLKHINKIMQHCTQNTRGAQLTFLKLFLSPSFSACTMSIFLCDQVEGQNYNHPYWIIYMWTYTWHTKNVIYHKQYLVLLVLISHFW